LHGDVTVGAERDDGVAIYDFV